MYMLGCLSFSCRGGASPTLHTPCPVSHRGRGEWLRHPTLRYSGLADAAFQFQLYQPLCFDRKFHRQFIEHFLGITIHD